MILEISFENYDLVNEIIENYPNLHLKLHDEHTAQGKKDSYSFKGTWAAKLSPFAILFADDGKVIHAFYSEIKDCTFDNINNYLISYE